MHFDVKNLVLAMLLTVILTVSRSRFSVNRNVIAGSSAGFRG